MFTFINMVLLIIRPIILLIFKHTINILIKQKQGQLIEFITIKQKKKF